MREIKFKWIGRNRKFGQIEISDALSTTDIIKGNYPSFFSFENRYSDYYTGGNCEFIAEILYTGLEDKNGKEIYEGDIMKNIKYGNTFFIDWATSDDYCGFMAETIVGLGEGYSTGLKGDRNIFLSKDFDNCEVIGNIYENPELLVL